MSSEIGCVGCVACGSLYIASAEVSCCPSCAGDLAQAEARTVAPFERCLPRQVSRADAAKAIEAFTREVWFPTPDLLSAARTERIQAVWWPRWLVDVDAVGIWEATVGFDYTVESSQEVYDHKRWQTKRILESRVRWEPRLGRVQRRYDNLSVAALSSESRRIALIGEPDLEHATSDTSRQDGLMQLPDRSPEDQWPLVLAALREKVGEDCSRATGGQHVRDVFLDIDASGAHFTLLLLPGYATWYRDDDGKAHVLLVDGERGRTGGPRMASLIEGRRWAMRWFGAGAAIVALGLLLGLVGLVIWLLLPLAGLAIFGGAVVSLVGLWPLLAPEQHNRAERAAEETGTAQQ